MSTGASADDVGSDNDESVDDEPEVAPSKPLPLPVIEVRDGIRIFGGLKSLRVQDARDMYRALFLDRYRT